nr:MAG TPA: hypothetical protein [Bacteriophage sp.]
MNFVRSILLIGVTIGINSHFGWFITHKHLSVT